MKKDFIYIGLILLIGLFALQSNFDIKLKSPDSIKIDSVKVTKETKEIKGGFNKVNPKPIIVKNYTSNDRQLKKIIKQLEDKYNQKADSITILLELLQAKKIRKYTEVFEDSIIKATINAKTEGTLKSINFKYVKKPQKITYYEKTTTKKVSPKFSLLLGGKINTSSDFRNSSLEINVGTQLRNGNVIELGYNTEKQISIGYKINIFRKY